MMRKDMILQLENLLKKKIGIKNNSSLNLTYLILLIVLFMTSLDTVNGVKCSSLTYFQLLDIFIEHMNPLFSLTTDNYFIYLEDVL